MRSFFILYFIDIAVTMCRPTFVVQRRICDKVNAFDQIPHLPASALKDVFEITGVLMVPHLFI